MARNMPPDPRACQGLLPLLRPSGKDVRLYSTGGGKGEERDAPDAAARPSAADA